MEKVAITTVYNACNYGSFLQAYALMKTIESMEYDVKFLKLPVAEDKIIGTDRLSGSYADYERKKYERLRMDQQAFALTSKADDSFKCCVIGSDTVWNLFDPAYGQIPYFLGKEIDSEKIISYAASVGQSRLLKIILLKFKDLLPIRKLDSISVRDDKTQTVVKLLGRKPFRVLDPTFLYEFKEEKPEEEIPDKYLLVYTYGFSEPEKAAIKEFAQKNSLKIVATGSLCQWADINVPVNSFQWLWLIKNAQAIVTNTFHGTVFSIKYNKKFAVLTRESDKVNSLLKEFNLENRTCSAEELKNVLANEIDYVGVNAVANEKIEKSIAYLKRAVGGK